MKAWLDDFAPLAWKGKEKQRRERTEYLRKLGRKNDKGAWESRAKRGEECITTTKDRGAQKGRTLKGTSDKDGIQHVVKRNK